MSTPPPAHQPRAQQAPAVSISSVSSSGASEKQPQLHQAGASGPAQGAELISPLAPVPAPPAMKRKRVQNEQLAKVLTHHVGFVGSGNMARALAEGIIASGQILPSSMTASATKESSENLKKMKALGVKTTIDNRDIILNSDIIILAVKPYQILSVMTEIQAMFADFQSHSGQLQSSPRSWRPLIVSVASSVSVSDIEQKTEISWSMGTSSISGHLPVIRTLPTVASSVRAGVTAYCKGKYCNESDMKPFLMIFSLCGHCEEVSEKYLDAITSVSGSGIAFAALMLEALADGAVMSGITRPMAQRFSAYTMMSVAKMVLEKGKHPAEIKDSVCSPGGTTIYGMQQLERGGVRGAIMSAVKAATDRAIELKPK